MPAGGGVVRNPRRSPLAELRLTAEDRATLERWTTRRKTAHGLAVRAEIVLRCSDGCSNSQVARELRLTNTTVGKWRSRFVAGGVAALLDEPRSGAPRRISDDQVETVIVKTLESTPRDATHWSVRSMAAATGMTRQSVHRIWKAFGLQPHRSETFKLSTDPQLIEKVRDIVGLYLNPPERALVLCADEKSSVPALDRTQPGLPLVKGRLVTMTHDYKRNGTTTLFAALEMTEGSIIGTCMDRHRHQEWIKFLKLIDHQTPPELDLHLIVDNYSTHKHPKVKAWLKRHPRFHLHFVPTSSSWLNMVERWFRDLTDKQIRRGVFKSIADLIAAIQAYIHRHNQNPKPLVWTAKAEDIIAKYRRAKAVLDKVQTA